MAFVTTGLKQTYRISYTGDREQTIVTTSPGDAALWEAQNAGQSFIDPATIGKMMWAAWRAARRQNLIEDKRFEDWRDQIADFELEDGEEVPDPTQPGA